MHYIIDGYNLFFYLFGSSFSDFKAQRQSLIQAMNTKIEFLALDVLLVFDSHFYPGEGSRSHYRHLEILFTPEGMNADDFIIKFLKLSRTPSKEVVVTNDRELSRRAKHLSASIQSIDYFLNWLDRRYSNKKRGKSKPIAKFKIPIESSSDRTPSPRTSASISSAEIPSTTSPPESRTKPKLLVPAAEIPESKPKLPEEIEGSFEYYLSTFQAAHESLLQAEKLAKIEKKLKKKSHGSNEDSSQR